MIVIGLGRSQVHVSVPRGEGAELVRELRETDPAFQLDRKIKAWLWPALFGQHDTVVISVPTTCVSYRRRGSAGDYLEAAGRDLIPMALPPAIITITQRLLEKREKVRVFPLQAMPLFGPVSIVWPQFNPLPKEGLDVLPPGGLSRKDLPLVRRGIKILWTSDLTISPLQKILRDSPLKNCYSVLYGVLIHQWVLPLA